MRATVGCARGVDAGRASEGLVGQECAPRNLFYDSVTYDIVISVSAMNSHETQGLEFFSGALSFQNLREISRLIGNNKSRCRMSPYRCN